MQKIVYTMPDGTMQVAEPRRNDKGETLVTDAAIEMRAWERIPAGAINPRFIDEKELTEDRYFRDAWFDAGAAIRTDRPKAEEIHKDNLRHVRSIMFPALDVAFTKALEALVDKLPLSDEDKAPIREIMAQKQVLRDVTDDPAIAAAATLDELKQVMPKAIVPGAVKLGVLPALEAKVS